MSKLIIVSIAALTLAFAGCDKSSSDGEKGTQTAEKSQKKASPTPAAPKKAVAPAPKPAPPPAAKPGKVELEVVDVPKLGKLKLPKGAKQLAPNNWSFGLPNFKSISVSWEPHGAKDLKDADSLSKILGNAPTVKTSKTLENGTHMIERVRDKDGWTFVAVFSDKWYVKCSAPQDKMDLCREIVTSKQ